MTDPALVAFVAESNRIEGIRRPPTDTEVEALARFVNLDWVLEGDLGFLVDVFQPGAVLRDRVGLNVYVGTHRPPPGGQEIVDALDGVLSRARTVTHPYVTH